MIKLFVGNRPIVLLLIPVIIGVLVVVNLFSDYYTYSEFTNLGMWGSSFQFPYGLTITIGPLLVLLNSTLLSRLFNSNGLLDKNTYITSLLYVVYFGFYHSFYQADGLLIAHTFLIATLYQLFKLHQNSDGRKNVFNAGFMAGVAITFHPASILFFPFIYFSVLVIRPFVLRELLLLVAGFLVPIIYGSIYLWFTSGEIDLQLLTDATGYEKKQIDFLVTAALFALSVLFSFLALSKQSQKTSIRTKKLNRVLLWVAISSLFLGLYDYIYFRQIERFSLTIIPLSIFLTFAFTNKSYFAFAKALFYIVLIYSILKLFL
ncbi:MAG: hypothetical protein KJ941_09215 [Bacteroidetes bacterium]|nr:hypothetical protein [Bacteroidota bacterium]